MSLENNLDDRRKSDRRTMASQSVGDKRNQMPIIVINAGMILLIQTLIIIIFCS